MTAKQYKINDLQSWNRLQLLAMQGLHVKSDPEAVAAFGEWFASLVDDLGHLPDWDEIRDASYSPFSY